MIRSSYAFTSESVSEGRPDKVCDRISDAVLDAVSEQQIERAVAHCMDLTPRGIRTHLALNKPIYQRTAAYGHFGRAPEADGGFSWERSDLIDALKAAV